MNILYADNVCVIFARGPLSTRYRGVLYIMHYVQRLAVEEWRRFGGSKTQANKLGIHPRLLQFTVYKVIFENTLLNL